MNISKIRKTDAISVVIPVYNSEQTIPELCQRLRSSLQRICNNFEIIMVDDCSRDQSWALIQECADIHNRITGIELSKNYGQHNALFCGIRLAQYDTIITLDDDLQNPPEEIYKLINKLDEGYDVVYGVPLKEKHNFLRNLASQCSKLVLQNAMGAETARQISAFRAFRKWTSDIFTNYQGSYINIDVLLTWGTTRFSGVRVRHDARKAGQSNYTFSKLAVHAINMFTGFTTIPLQIASFIGFIFTLFGICILVFVIGRWILHGSVVPGFAFLASIIAIFSGAQLFALGILGEYLARVHFKTMEKPVYGIRSKTNPSVKSSC